MGLTSAEVSERVARGQRNAVPSAPSRTVGQIVRGNTFTVFNAILGTLTVVVLVYGNWRDALFGLVVVANTGIGIIQELRAKATLDRLAVLGAVRPTVLRDGERRVVEPGEIVLDDVLPVSSGDRIVVDGVVCASAALEVDESLLTGESDPVHKQVGDPVLSGSFAVAGTGCYQATAVGSHAFAAGLAEEARRFTLVHSQLMASINTILRVMVTIMVPVAVLLTWSQLRSHEHLGTAVSGAVAGVITMIPEGLVLLTSVAFAVGVVRLGRHQVLVQELPAVELLARVDVVCLDKTGTLTEPGMHAGRRPGRGRRRPGSAGAGRAGRHRAGAERQPGRGRAALPARRARRRPRWWCRSRPSGAGAAPPWTAWARGCSARRTCCCRSGTPPGSPPTRSPPPGAGCSCWRGRRPTWPIRTGSAPPGPRRCWCSSSGSSRTPRGRSPTSPSRASPSRSSRGTTRGRWPPW